MGGGNWVEIANEADIERLLSAFGGFHDSCIREIYYWTAQFVDAELSMHCQPDTHVRVLIQRQWKDPTAVELTFGEVTGFGISPPRRGYSLDIEGMWITKSEEGFLWSESPPEETPSGTWIAARTLWWRDASDWMGDTIRYGSLEGLPDLPLFNSQ